MTLSISNIYHSVKISEAPKFLEGKEKIKLIVDAALIGCLVTIGALILSGRINVDIPGGVGTLKSYLAIGFIGAGGALALTDVITSIIRRYRETRETHQGIDAILKSGKSKEEKIAACREIIKSAKRVEISKDSRDRKTPSNQVMGNLFIGRDSALVQAASLCSEITVAIQSEEGDYELKYEGLNPQKYSTVITLCPVNAALYQFPALVEENDEKSAAKIQKQFEKNSIEWIYIGKTIEDSSDYWKALAYDCTFLSTNIEDKNVKINFMETTDKEWFKPIFEKIDKAVFEGKNTLVHCQAGQSRSATVLAAYLIYTFDVSKDEALTFLQSRRPSVNSKFEAQLDEYAKS